MRLIPRLFPWRMHNSKMAKPGGISNSDPAILLKGVDRVGMRRKKPFRGEVDTHAVIFCSSIPIVLHEVGFAVFHPKGSAAVAGIGAGSQAFDRAAALYGIMQPRIGDSGFRSLFHRGVFGGMVR